MSKISYVFLFSFLASGCTGNVQCRDNDDCRNSERDFCTIVQCEDYRCVERERDCSDGVACTQDSCSEDARACHHQPQDDLCNDGLNCDGTEICDPEVGCLPGDEPDCDDDIECTVDTCNQDQDECIHIPDDNLCDDGSVCNGVETCDLEVGCLSGEPLDCDDGLLCNGEELCDPEEGCIEGSLPDCDDGIDCTRDSCDEDESGCVHEPDDNLCDNRLFCDGIERCDETEGCVAGEPVECTDDDPCTEDLCDEETDSCVSRPADGLPCDYGEGPSSGHCLAGECVEAGCGDGFVDLGLEECDSGPDGTVGCTSECLSVDFRLSGLDPEPDRNGTQILFEVDRAVSTLADGRFVAVWTRNINSGCGPPDWPEELCGKDVEGRFFTVDGEPDGPVMVLNPDPDMRQQMPVVAPLGDGFIVAWVGDDRSTGARDDIFVRAFDATGEPRGGQRQVNVRTYGFQDHPTMTSVPGGAFLAWEGPDPDRDDGLYLRQLDESGRPVDDELLVSSPGRWRNEDASLATSSDGTVVLLSWVTQEGGFDYPWIVALLIDAATGELLTDEMALVEPIGGVRRHSVTSTALPDGGFYVAWVRWDGGPTAIEGIFVDDDGELGTANLLTPSSELAEYEQPSIAAFPDGTLALAWGHGNLEPIDGWTHGIGGQLFELVGDEWAPEPLCEPVALNTSFHDDQTLPHVAVSGEALGLCFVDDDNEGEDLDPELVRCRVLPGGWLLEL